MQLVVMLLPLWMPSLFRSSEDIPAHSQSFCSKFFHLSFPRGLSHPRTSGDVSESVDKVLMQELLLITCKQNDSIEFGARSSLELQGSMCKCIFYFFRTGNLVAMFTPYGVNPLMGKSVFIFE